MSLLTWPLSSGQVVDDSHKQGKVYAFIDFINGLESKLHVAECKLEVSEVIECVNDSL